MYDSLVNTQRTNRLVVARALNIDDMSSKDFQTVAHPVIPNLQCGAP